MSLAKEGSNTGQERDHYIGAQYSKHVYIFM